MRIGRKTTWFFELEVFLNILEQTARQKDLQIERNQIGKIEKMARQKSSN